MVSNYSSEFFTMFKKPVIFLLPLLILAVGCSKKTNVVDTASGPQQSHTMQEISEANNNSKCWVVIHGYVYDLTNWINKHPGGPNKILQICGTDATTVFDNQHEGEGRPAETLKAYQIGKLTP